MVRIIVILLRDQNLARKKSKAASQSRTTCSGHVDDFLKYLNGKNFRDMQCHGKNFRDM